MATTMSQECSGRKEVRSPQTSRVLLAVRAAGCRRAVSE